MQVRSSGFYINNYEHFLAVYEPNEAEHKFSVSTVLPQENTPVT